MQIALGIKLHVGIDHEENIRNGLKEEQSIRKLCRDWQLTRGEVVGILAEEDADMNKHLETGEFV